MAKKLGRSLGRFSKRLGAVANGALKLGANLSPYASALLETAGQSQHAETARKLGSLAGNYRSELTRNRNDVGKTIGRNVIGSIARQQLAMV